MEKVWSPDSYQTVRNKSSAVTRQEMNCDVEYEPSLQNLNNTKTRILSVDWPNVVLSKQDTQHSLHLAVYGLLSY